MKQLRGVHVPSTQRQGAVTPILGRQICLDGISTEERVEALGEVQTLVAFLGVTQFHSSVDTAWTVVVRFPQGARYYSVFPSVQRGSGAHPAFCPMGTEYDILGDKAGGTRG
jgi:hypothetical protein